MSIANPHILHINGFEQKGGAAKAANRLHQGLYRQNVNSQMLVLYQQTHSKTVMRPPSQRDRILYRIAEFAERRPLRAYPNRSHIASWNNNRFPTPARKNINAINPDIVHLHWAHPAMVPIKTIAQLKQPVIWTLHDMWAMTGGCHYTMGCTAYEHECGNCPILNSDNSYDLSYKNLQHKRQQWQHKQFHIITPSRWLGERARASSVLKHMPIHVIPNGIDLNVFRKYDRHFARELFGLPSSKKLVLFGAEVGTTDPRKGFHHLESALHKLAIDNDDDIELVVFGYGDKEDSNLLPFKIHYVGFIHDDRLLALLYSAVNVFVGPSTEEVFGLTIAESLACGTPVVGFQVGGLLDMITHQQNGFLATPFDTDELAEGICWVLDDETDWAQLSDNARNKAEAYFDIKTVVKQHKVLYENILATRKFSAH